MKKSADPRSQLKIHPKRDKDKKDKTGLKFSLSFSGFVALSVQTDSHPLPPCRENAQPSENSRRTQLLPEILNHRFVRILSIILFVVIASQLATLFLAYFPEIKVSPDQINLLVDKLIDVIFLH